MGFSSVIEPILSRLEGTRRWPPIIGEEGWCPVIIAYRISFPLLISRQNAKANFANFLSEIKTVLPMRFIICIQ
jgi:hypothetical protein